MDVVARSGEADVLRVTRSEQVAFSEFYEQNYRPALRLAVLMVRNQGDAAEVVQDSFTAAFGRWGRVSGLDRPDLWLRRVIINGSISRRRRQRSEAGAMSRMGRVVDRPTVDGPAGVEVWVLVGGLPARQAQSLVLVYGCDLSLADASMVMRCSVGSVKTHLSRGRKALAEILKEDS